MKTNMQYGQAYDVALCKQSVQFTKSDNLPARRECVFLSHS